MRKILYFIVIISAIAIFVFLFMLQNEESSPDIIKINEKKESIATEIVDDFRNDEEEQVNKIVEKSEIELISKVVAKNENMILDFLNNYPQELKWVNIYLFDFTKDGEMNIWQGGQGCLLTTTYMTRRVTYYLNFFAVHPWKYMPKIIWIHSGCAVTYIGVPVTI